MNCEQARTSLLDYLLAEVSDAERLEIRQHVDGCEACAGEMARLKQTMTLLVRAEVPEEIPQRIRLVAEPVSWAAMFWRNSARLAFAGAGLACLAIGLLALSRANISYSNGGWEIAFGSRPAAPVVPIVGQTVGAPGGPDRALDRADVARLIAEAVTASEARQQESSAKLIQSVSQQVEQQRLQDLRELSQGVRYLQAAQTMMWKDQVQNQQVMGALARQVGLPSAQP